MIICNLAVNIFQGMTQGSEMGDWWVRLATAFMSLKTAMVLEDVPLILVAEKLSKNPFMKAKEVYQCGHW